MNYEKRIVCYFDILGFKNAVLSNRLSADAVSQLLAEIDDVMGYYGKDTVDGTYFSDSFAVSIKIIVAAKTQLDFIVKILEKLIEYRFLARGGLAYGDLVHDNAKIFGPALVKAVELEKKARYPRIIIDDSLRELTIPTIGNATIDYLSFLTNFVYIKNDPEDGLPYIDYIYSILAREHKGASKTYKDVLDEIISEGLHASDERIIEKYEWLAKKVQTAKVSLGIL